MADLSLQAVHEFWQQYQDPMIYRVIAFMEGVEPWTKDGDPHLEAAMEKLGQELENIGKVDMDKLGQEDAFVRICTNIKTGRALRLLQAVDTIHPGAASKLLIYAEENSQSSDDPAGIFLRRNIVFERLRLLARVFSPARIALVMRALEGDESES